MQLLGVVQGNMSNDKLTGCHWSRLWHDLSQFSVCSSARGKLPRSWGCWDRESDVQHPSADPGMWVPGIRQAYSGLSTGKAHACLDKPSGEHKMLILPLKRRNASSQPLQLLFSGRPCAWCAAAPLFLCRKKSEGHRFYGERRVGAAAAAEQPLTLLCVKAAHLSPLKLVSVVGCNHAIDSLMTRGIVQKTKDLRDVFNGFTELDTDNIF